MNPLLSLFLLGLTTLVAPAQNTEPSPEELVKRQCRSVHLNHSNIPEKSLALYMVAHALKSAPGTYFSAGNFNDGYIGFQDQGEGKKVIIFSIWDPIAKGDNPQDVPENERVQLVKLGETSRSQRFGGEGTGGQSFVDYPWEIGEKMQFLVVRKPLDNKFKEISGYYYNNNTKKWELISRWKTHSSPKELSFVTSFVEDFRRNYVSAGQVRAASYGPVFAYGPEKKWVRATGGKFTADVTPSTNVRAEYNPQYKAITIQTGGDTKPNENKLWSTLTLPEEIISNKDDFPSQEVTDLANQ